MMKLMLQDKDILSNPGRTVVGASGKMEKARGESKKDVKV